MKVWIPVALDLEHMTSVNGKFAFQNDENEPTTGVIQLGLYSLVLYSFVFHRCTKIPSPPYAIEKEQLVQGLCPSVKLDVYFPGFPTLKHIAHTCQLERWGVRVFQAASRGDNMCLTILPMEVPKVRTQTHVAN